MLRDLVSEQRELLKVRQFMDRRRLEEGFLLYACLEVKVEYILHVESIPYDKTELAKIVVQQYESVFCKKWTGINFIHMYSYIYLRVCSYDLSWPIKLCQLNFLFLGQFAICSHMRWAYLTNGIKFCNR